MRVKIAASYAGLLAVFDAQSDSIAAPNYHGCAFVNAGAEASPDSSIQEVTAEYRGWIRGLFTDLARAADGRATARLTGADCATIDWYGLPA